MSRTVTEDLLATIDALYNVALSPSQYDIIADDLDRYISNLDPDSDQAKSLMGHVEKALNILERLHTLREDFANEQAMIDAEPGAAALVAPDGSILASNPSWQGTYPNAGGSAFDIAPLPEDGQRVRSALRTLHEVSEQRTSFVRFVGQSDEFVHLTISRIANVTADDGPTRYIFRTGQTIWSTAISELMATEFSLTPAEIALLRRMVLGHSFSAIAEETGRGVETLKSQSKSIYRKMHVTGREDAVRVAYQLHLLLQSGQSLRKPLSMINRSGSVERGDGRRLVWTARGAPRGKPVIFLHGMGLGHGFTQTFETRLADQGLRLICVDRPGYGYSDPPEDLRSNLSEWTEFYPILLDELGIDQAPIVTHTSGVLYGCAAATAHSDRVEQVCALAGGVPITDSAMLADYPTQIRLLSRASRFSVQLFRFVFSSYAAFYRSEKGRNRIIRRTYGEVPSDARALEDPEVNRLVHDGMSMVSVAGFDGFIGDGLRMFRDWSDQVRDMNVPLHYVIGEDDPICPVTWAQAFAQKYAHVDVTSIPGAGQLLHHSHPHDVVEALVRFGFGRMKPVSKSA